MKRVKMPKDGGDDKNAVDRFINKASENETDGATYPWELADDRITRGFGLRLTESELLKLKFISENTPHSIHGFIMKILRPAIDQEIEKLTQ